MHKVSSPAENEKMISPSVNNIVPEEESGNRAEETHSKESESVNIIDSPRDAGDVENRMEVGVKKAEGNWRTDRQLRFSMSALCERLTEIRNQGKLYPGAIYGS